VEISGKYGFPTWLGAGTLHLGIAQAMTGLALESIVIIDPALDMWRTAGAELFVTYYLCALAAARWAAGDLEGARRHVDEALVGVEQRGERFYEAELLRLRGELIVEEAPHKVEEGIASLWEAVEVARRQGARTFELRAITSLHRAAAETGRDLDTASLLETTLLSFGDDLEMPEIDRARATLAAVRT
jgi:predicted ATPase